MSTSKQRGRKRLIFSLFGLVFTSLLSIWSEVAGLYYNQRPSGPGNFFALDRSSIMLVVCAGEDDSFFSGIVLYQPGWNRIGVIQKTFVPRYWWPIARSSPAGQFRLYQARIPLWIPAVSFAATAWWAWRLCRRFGAGCCAACGYQVTGVVGGKCPECGRTIDAVG